MDHQSTQWDMGYLDLLKYEWNVRKVQGTWQWHPINCAEEDLVPELAGTIKKSYL